MKLLPPNLRGDYRGSCVICLAGTDTGLAFTGPAETRRGDRPCPTTTATPA